MRNESLALTSEEMDDLISNTESNIDWEQRRYEIAKSIAQAIWASTKEATFEQCADFSIKQANILIKKLKDENKRL